MLGVDAPEPPIERAGDCTDGIRLVKEPPPKAPAGTVHPKADRAAPLGDGGTLPVPGEAGSLEGAERLLGDDAVGLLRLRVATRGSGVGRSTGRVGPGSDCSEQMLLLQLDVRSMPATAS